MRPKLQRIGYLPVFNMRLNRLIKSQLRVFYGSLSGFRTSFNMLSISGAKLFVFSLLSAVSNSSSTI